jgi:hypothetical protein
MPASSRPLRRRAQPNHNTHSPDEPEFIVTIVLAGHKQAASSPDLADGVECVGEIDYAGRAMGKGSAIDPFTKLQRRAVAPYNDGRYLQQHTGHRPACSEGMGASRMNRVLLFALLLLTGCQSVSGPRDRQCRPAGPVDNPCLTIDEQKARGRDQLAIPETSNVAPPTYMESPWTRSSR